MEELSGCWREAARADAVAIELLKIRTHLTSSSVALLSSSFSSHPHYPSPSDSDSHPDSPDITDYEIITAILRHVEQTSRLLRDLHDLFPIFRLRVPVVIYYLTVILPCLQKTLRDMLAFLMCDDWSIRMKWTLMHERLNEQGGMTLALRFVMYVDFLVQCVRLLSRWVNVFQSLGSFLEGNGSDRIASFGGVRGLVLVLLLVLDFTRWDVGRSGMRRNWLDGGNSGQHIDHQLTIPRRWNCCAWEF